MPLNLSVVEILPQAEHRYTIICLHGLGADGHDFEGIVPALRLEAEAHIHFIFPNAPIRPVTINGGYRMRAWFDVLEFGRRRRIDLDALYQSSEAIASLIREEIGKGIPSKHILLAGFSQGGSVVLHAGLRFPQPLAGIVALSTYLPAAEALAKEQSQVNRTVPIFMAHGSYDSVIGIQTAKETLSALEAQQYQVRWHEYAMEHVISQEEIEHIAAFINECFSKP